jgi:hypothetical protein
MHEAHIIFGETPEKYQHFYFETQVELNAFFLGLEANSVCNDYRKALDMTEDEIETLKEMSPEDHAELMNYRIIKETESKYFISYCLIHQDYIEPLAIAFAYPLANRIEIRITESARKHTENPQKFFKTRRLAESVTDELRTRALTHIESQTVLVTGCSAKKIDNSTTAAGELYKSTRISFAKRIAQEKALPLYILSAKYGLINQNDIISTYDQKMDEARVNELIPQVVKQLQYDKIQSLVFFAAGVNASYKHLLSEACSEANVNFKQIGSGCMQGAKELPMLLDSVSNQNIEIKVCNFVPPVINSAPKGQLRLF